MSNRTVVRAQAIARATRSKAARPKKGPSQYFHATGWRKRIHGLRCEHPRKPTPIEGGRCRKLGPSGFMIVKERFFRAEDHPYRIFEREIQARLKLHHTLLDAGCGRSGELLWRFRGKAKRLIGVDMVDFEAVPTTGDIELIKGDLSTIDLDADSADLVISRSVLEHLQEPLPVYEKVYRVLRRGGSFISLTPNLWDYASLVSKLVPNRLHPWIVARTEGRNENDTFPAYYRSNTYRAIRRLSAKSRFDVESFRYLGQYPSYFLFSRFMFLLATGYEKLISRFDLLAFLRGWLLIVLRK